MGIAASRRARRSARRCFRARWSASSASAALVVAALLAFPARAVRASEAVPEGEPRASEQAESQRGEEALEALLAEAVAEHEAGRYPEALALFRRAHEIAPTARTLRAIGMASYELRQYTTAVRALRESLESTARRLTDAQRSEVEGLIARALRFVAVVHLTVEPSDAAVLLDGAPPVREPDGSLLLDHGPHTLTARHPDHLVERLQLQLDPGSTQTVTVTLVRRPDFASEDEPASGGEPSPRASESRPRGGDEVLGWTAAGLGTAAALAAVTATVMGIVALTDRETLASECNGYVCPAALRGTRDRARALALGADVTGAVAAALGGTAIVLAILAATGGEAEGSTFGASCTTDGCTGWITGRF